MMRVGMRRVSGVTVMVAVAAAVVVSGLSGCATNGMQNGAPNSQAASRSKSTVGQVVYMNGIQLTEVDRSAFPRGKFKEFPVIAQRADFATLNTMSKDYARASWEAAAQKDWEAFTVNRHLGMRIVEYRLHHTLATTAFVDSLSSRGDGSGVLAAGATIFLPGFTRWGAAAAVTPVKMSSVEAITLDLASNGVVVPDWAAAPKVADIGGLLNVIKTASDVMNGGVAAGGAKQVAAQKQANNLLAQLPIGKTFTAHDTNGNSYIVERTDDGFIVGNSGERPVPVPLGSLGFVPDMPMPNAERQAAAPLVMTMQASRQTLFWRAMREHYAFPLSATRAPNKIIVLNTKISGFFDANGRIATDTGAIASGAAAYESKPGYKTAVEMSDYSSHRDMAFQTACFDLKGHAAYDTDYVGEYAEILQHKCLNSGQGVLRQKDVYVIDGKKMQTFASLVQDKELAKALKNADNKKDLVESVVGFVPGVGNFDAGAKCLTGTSLTSWVSTNAAQYAENMMPLDLLSSELKGKIKGASRLQQSRAFVSDLLGPSEDATTLSKSLTCAAALPALGTVVGKVAKVGSWLTGYRNWMATENAAGVLKTISLFDANPFAKGATVPVYQTGALSEASLAVMKKYYDGLQIVESGRGLVSSGQAVFDSSAVN